MHRRVRRDEELNWIKHSSITIVLSLLGSSHNLDAYAAAGIPAHHIPVEHPSDAVAKLDEIYVFLDKVLTEPGQACLVHFDDFNEILCGILAGYLVHACYVPTGTVAVALVERITGRPMSPEGREIAFSALPGKVPEKGV